MKKWQWIWVVGQFLGMAGCAIVVSIVSFQIHDIQLYWIALGCLLSGFAVMMWGWNEWGKNV